MRAWQHHDLADPIDCLQLDEIDDVTAGAGEVVVDIEAVGISFPDVLQCRGEYQVKPPLPHIPGGESAGTVSEVGDGVEHLAVGDRVMVMGGGLRERAAIKARSAWKIPDALSAAKAAAIPVNYGTTWFALHERGHLQAGETLLVTGAAGGTGSAAIQLGKAAGATVIAVAGGEEKVARCSELGADVVINHHETPDFVDAVREASGGGVDVAYDPVGGDTTQHCRRSMAWDGRLLIIGFVAGIPQIPTNHILLKNYSVVGVHWGASMVRDPGSLDRQMQSVLELAGNDGAVDPLIYPPYRFEDGARAVQDLAERKTWGKVIVSTVPGS